MARQDPYANFRFLVEIEGLPEMQFSEVMMPDASADVIEYREGGEPSTVRKLPGLIRYRNLTLKRGFTGSRDLFNWWRTVVDGTVDRRNVSVRLLNAQREEVARWNFFNAFPARYDVSDLKGQGNEVVIETIEIAHEGMELETND